MADNLQIRITSTADTSGFKAAGSSLDQMSASGNIANQVFGSIKAAASGNIQGLLGVAQAVKSVAAAFRSLSGAQLMLGGIGLALAAIQVAWSYWQKKQEAAQKAAEELGQRLDRQRALLKGLLAAQQKEVFTIDAETTALKNLGDAYDRTASRAEKLNAAREKLASLKTDLALATLDQQENQALSANPENAPAIAREYSVRRLNAIQVADQAELAAKQTDLLKQRAAAQKAVADLAAQQATAPDVLRAKEKIDATKKELIGKNAPEARAKLAEQEVEYKKLAASEQARQDQVAKAIQLRQDETEELDRQLEILKAQAAVSSEQFTAQSDKLARENAAAAAAEIDARQAEKAKAEMKTLTDRRDQLREHLDAARELPVQEAKQNAAKAADQASYAQRMVLDKAFRKSEEARIKQEKKNEDEIQKRADRARRAKALGATGKHLDAAIAAGDLALAAKDAKTAADNLEKKQAADIAATKTAIKNIEKTIADALTLGGTAAGGV
jgi:hypothetical protein